MNPIRNIHFTLLIKLNNRLHEFNFRKRKDDTYDADTSDDRGNRHYFRILFKDNTWSMTGAHIPGWIRENESAIIQCLKEKAQYD